MNFVSLRNIAAADAPTASLYVRAGALDALQLARLLSRDGGNEQDLSIGGFISALGCDDSETQLLE